MTPLTAPRRSARPSAARPLLAALLLLSLGTAAQAQTSPQPLRRGEGPRLSETQRQKLFPEARSLAVQDHRARIAILQQGERCISAAASGDALRDCMRQERQAMQSQRQRHHTAMRQAMQRLGIQVPEGPAPGMGPQGRRPPGQPYGWDHPGQPAPPF